VTAGKILLILNYLTMSKKLKKYVEKELKKMERGIVATPLSREYLESFANANQGSMDILLMQMSINFGYKIALENVADEIQAQHGI
jgi:hypothetical protein